MVADAGRCEWSPTGVHSPGVGRDYAECRYCDLLLRPDERRLVDDDWVALADLVHGVLERAGLGCVDRGTYGACHAVADALSDAGWRRTAG